MTLAAYADHFLVINNDNIGKCAGVMAGITKISCANVDGRFSNRNSIIVTTYTSSQYLGMVNLVGRGPEESGVAIFTLISCRDMVVRFSRCNGAMAGGASTGSCAVVHARGNRKAFS